MRILSIDTSCDETAAAVTDGRRIISSIIYSQILIHKKWGGVVPSLAKRAHEERIDFVVHEALRRAGIKNPRSDIDSIAVTYGPGLAIALEVGIRKAKELATLYRKKLVAVNHMEGHIYSCFAQNRKGNPAREIRFPYLVLLISGGHTQLVFLRDHLQYELLGETIDDAAGEALDKAAKMLGLGYPGGPVIERLAEEVAHRDSFKFPRPLSKKNDLRFSFSGLKTSFFYFLKRSNTTSEVKNIRELASSFQEAVFDSLLMKTDWAIQKTKINRLLVGGGVVANMYLRGRFRALMRRYQGEVFFPPYRTLTGDNAAMIGIAAYYKALKNQFVTDISKLDRTPRLSLS